MVSGMLPEVIALNGFSITAESGSTMPAPTIQPPLLYSEDLAIVPPARTGVALRSDGGPLDAALRFRVRALVRAVHGFRISQIRGSVSSGIVGTILPGFTAAVRTRTTLGGVALPPTASTTEGPTDSIDIPTTAFPALRQCFGNPCRSTS